MPPPRIWASRTLGHIVRIMARRARPAEADGRLRHVEIDDLRRPDAGERRRACTSASRAFVGQIGEDLVDQPGRAFRIDRADDADIERAARDEIALQRDEIGALDRRQGLERAIRSARHRDGRENCGRARRGRRASRDRWPRGAGRALSCSRTRAIGASSSRGALIARRSNSAARSTLRISVRIRPPI